MFTGIVEEVGTVVSVDTAGDSARLVVRGPLVTTDAAHGCSIAVNGVCLTVTTLDGDTFAVDVMAETLRRSSLGQLQTGSPVNLERAVRADARLGGHVVQGHVDGVAVLTGRTPGDHWESVRFDLPPTLSRYVVEKGSIAVDGVSLTVAAVSPPESTKPWFAVGLIPTTLSATTLGAAPPGTGVNIEVDVLAKYVERILATPSPQPIPNPRSGDAE